jgi:hypothetical protein
MSQPAAALYIQPPMLETIVATQSIANVRYRNGSSGDAPVERFFAATTQPLLGAARCDLYCRPSSAQLAVIDPIDVEQTLRK